MQIWAHRGVSAHAPENTLPAFEAALALPVEGVELDVHLTADGEAVVCHDERIDRTSDGAGLIADMTLAQLRAFDFSQVEGKDFAGFSPCRIPTLEEVLRLVAPSGKRVNIELKTDEMPYPGIEEKVFGIIRACGMEDRVVVSSFNRESVARFKALGSGIPVAFLFYEHPKGLRRGVAAGEWDALHPRFALCPRHMPAWLRKRLGALNLQPSLVPEAVVKLAHDAGMPVRVYTVDDPDMAHRLAERGVDAVFANDPAALMASL